MARLGLARLALARLAEASTSSPGIPAADARLRARADVPELGRVVRDLGARLLVVDPLAAYLSGEVDAHRDQDVRRALHALSTLADATGCTVLVLRGQARSRSTIDGR